MNQTIEIRVPDIGDFDQVEVIEILIKEGDLVELEAPLITLESDKATMDVPAPISGQIDEIRVVAGDRVSQGSLILIMQEKSTTTSDGANRSKETVKTDNGNSLSDSAQQITQLTASGQELNPVQPPPPISTPISVKPANRSTSHASPSVRRFAHELGADLNLIEGSGPKGRILRGDILGFVKKVLTTEKKPSAPASSIGIPAIPEVDFSQWGKTEIQSLSRIQRVAVTHLHRAWLNIPHVTHHDEIDITNLEAFRKSISNKASKDIGTVTLLPFILKAVAAALKEFPTFNSSLSPDGKNLILKRYFHIGIAVDTPQGLVVPVLRNVLGKGIMELATDIKEAAEKARDRKLTLEDMLGGCITISNLGGIGGTSFTPIVNAPEVAILGVSRAHMAPIWNGSSFDERLMLPLDLSFDHRVINGAEAARFVVFLGSLLQDSRHLLL